MMGCNRYQPDGRLRISCWTSLCRKVVALDESVWMMFDRPAVANGSAVGEAFEVKSGGAMVNPLIHCAVVAAGVVGGAFGAWRLKKAEPCPNFQPKANFAWSDRRLRRLFPGCAADLSAARRSVAWDYLLIAGYVTALLGAAWWLAPTVTGGALMLMVGLSVAAGAVDMAENLLLVGMLGVDQHRFAFVRGPASAGKPWGPRLLAVITGVKFLLLVAAVGVVLRSWLGR